MNEGMVGSSASAARLVAWPARTELGRYFYSVAALLMLIITAVGFSPFYLAGEGMAGRKIGSEIFPVVVAHGTFMTAWMALFLIQSLLVSARRRTLHITLGWGGIAVATGVTVTGVMVAVESVRPIPAVPFWGMAYQQFLLVMLAEVAMFTLFVVTGVCVRKRPVQHRPMMLLATLSILAGATVRMPILFPVFGESGWVGIFGPIFVLGAAFVLARSLLLGALDRWLAAGFAAMVLVYVAACEMAVGETWSRLANALLKV